MTTLTRAYSRMKKEAKWMVATGLMVLILVLGTVAARTLMEFGREVLGMMATLLS